MKFFLLALIALGLVGCATGHCRARKGNQPATVFVYKSDGSKQCAMGAPVSLETMAEELKTLTSAFRLSDEEDEDGDGTSTERLAEEELDNETTEGGGEEM